MNFKSNSIHVLISLMDIRDGGTMLFKSIAILQGQRVILNNFNHMI